MFHDIETGEIVEREMNNEELAQKAKDEAELEELKNAEKARTQAKIDLLNRLGITDDEAKLLLS